ncbi:MAG: sterol desaturase family protein [Bacteroidetes bacterium]|nr:sterol desaturase family protein [Bacteroidota bacterium]MBS1757206.1 sterol desaturase family protein [Bacteroidota bacterium]
MHHWLHFLDKYSSPMQILLFAGLLCICWNIENIAGLAFNYKKWRHAFVNAGFIFTNIPVQFLLGFAFIKTIQWTGEHHFGIMRHLHLGHIAFFKQHYFIKVILLFTITFVLLDLGEYIYHVIMHKVKRLWMFHIVHHSDNVVDVSTTLREHPGESCIRLCFTLIWVFLTGAFFWALLLRQIVQTFATLFAHMHYRLPQKIDSIVGLVFITPNLHHVHHHFKQPYTDTNYGDVLSIWDRLFGTFQKMPEEKLIYGVDTYMRNNEIANFKSLIKIPFGKYRKAKH